MSFPKIISFSGKKHSGKCLGINTHILMYNGCIKLVQDIKKNDLIMGDDSTPRKVLSITNGIENLYEINHFNHNESYIVNESHILSLYYTFELTKITSINFRYVFTGCNRSVTGIDFLYSLLFIQFH